MHYKEFLSHLEDFKVSEESKKEQLKEFIQPQNHLLDDHGLAVIGRQDAAPLFHEYN